MSDPENRRDGDFQERRSAGFEPADNRMWELPVQETAFEDQASASPRRWLLPGILIIIAIVVLAIFLIL